MSVYSHSRVRKPLYGYPSSAHKERQVDFKMSSQEIYERKPGHLIQCFPVMFEFVVQLALLKLLTTLMLKLEEWSPRNGWRYYCIQQVHQNPCDVSNLHIPCTSSEMVTVAIILFVHMTLLLFCITNAVIQIGRFVIHRWVHKII